MSITIDGIEYAGIIYKIENRITHEVYIGQTTNSRGFDGRYDFKGKGIERVHKYLKGNQDRGERHNQHLRRSIEKFGYDAFDVTEVFDVAHSYEELNNKEAHYIKLFNSYKNGYNQTFGGDSISGYKRPSGKDCPNSKRVCQIGLDGKLIAVWDSITIASMALNIDISSISDVCHCKKKTAGGFAWALEKDYDPNTDYSRTRQKKDWGRGTKPVLWLDDEGHIIREFYSLNSVSEVLDICPQSTSDICNHKTKHPKFNLVFKSEYMEEQRLSVRGLCDQAS